MAVPRTDPKAVNRAEEHRPGQVLELPAAAQVPRAGQLSQREEQRGPQQAHLRAGLTTNKPALLTA